MEWEFDPEEYEREKAQGSKPKAKPSTDGVTPAVDKAGKPSQHDNVSEDIDGLDMDFLDLPAADDEAQPQRVSDNEGSGLFNEETQVKIKEARVKAKQKMAEQSSVLSAALVSLSAKLRVAYYSARASAAEKRIAAAIKKGEAKEHALKMEAEAARIKKGTTREPALLDLEEQTLPVRTRNDLYTAPSPWVYNVLYVFLAASLLALGYYFVQEKFGWPDIFSGEFSTSTPVVEVIDEPEISTPLNTVGIEGAATPPEPKENMLFKQIQMPAPTIEQENSQTPSTENLPADIAASPPTHEVEPVAEPEVIEQAPPKRVVSVPAAKPTQKPVQAKPQPAPLTQAQRIEEEERLMFEEQMRKLDEWGKKNQ